MPRRATALRRRAYGGNAADGLSVRGACTCTAARRRGFDAPRGGKRVGVWVTQAGRALGGARPREARARMPGPAARGARDVAACNALAHFVLLVLPLTRFFSKFLYRS
jgi:hypothetical protein